MQRRQDGPGRKQRKAPWKIGCAIVAASFAIGDDPAVAELFPPALFSHPEDLHDHHPVSMPDVTARLAHASMA